MCVHISLSLWPLFMDGLHNCLEAEDPLRRDTLLFTTMFPKIYGTLFINLGLLET